MSTIPHGKPFELPWGRVHPPIYLIVAFIWSMVFAVLSAYDPNVLDGIRTFFLALVFSTLTFGGPLFFGYRLLSRLLLVYFLILDLCGIIVLRILWQMVFKSFEHERVPHRDMLIVGADDVGREVVRVFSDLSWMGLKVFGYPDGDFQKQTMELPSYPF